MRKLLDISRTVSRSGAGFMTGIDRVEYAYITEFQNRFEDAYFIAKLGQKYAVLDSAQLAQFMAANETGDFGHASGLDRFRLRLTPQQRAVRTKIRAVVGTLVKPDDLGEYLAKKIGQPFGYYNVAHSNLSLDFFASIKKAGCQRITGLVHDLIPINFPEYSADGIPEKFSVKMRALAEYADRIICNSNSTAKTVEQQFSRWGAQPDIRVAYLGVDHLQMKPKADAGLTARPYFLTVGTIEPRKNHIVLFKAWEQLAKELPPDQMPALYIVGRRGWRNEEVFRYLDTAPLMGKHIFEVNDLSDGALVGAYHRATAVLFPSFVEGYGLPAVESLRYGTPVICSDIDVFRELLEENATFLDATDNEKWASTVKLFLGKAKESARLQPERFKASAWSAHFDNVFAL